MTTLRSILAGLMLALVACVAAPATPAAAQGEAETGAYGAFQVRGTNGFSILGIAFSRPQFKHGEVVLFVFGNRAAAIYFAPARVEPAVIEADLGPVGEITVHFEPSGPPERVHSHCEENGSVVFEPGFWTGKFRFEGEEGFTRAAVARTKAIVDPFFERGRCGSTLISETGGLDVEGARLIARAASARESRFLQANQNRQGARVHLEAEVEERRDGLVVDRQVSGYFPSMALAFASPLRTATLAPPTPFDGRATFHRNAKRRNRWTGNLTVDFPGRADVPLAGKRFQATLGHWSRTESTTRRRLVRPNLLPWPSTKLSLTVFATPSLFAPG